MGIRRMIARRGEIRDLYSDNGTNLRGRGADREMTDREMTDREMTEQSENWTMKFFITIWQTE
jgi:hypothetical protein